MRMRVGVTVQMMMMMVMMMVVAVVVKRRMVVRVELAPFLAMVMAHRILGML
jgi:hypothetical protein